MLKEKKLWVVVSLVFIVLLVAACGGNDQQDGQDETGSSGVTLELLTFFNPDGTGTREVAFKQIADDFTAETGIEISYTVVPWNEVNQQLILSEEAGNSPDISFVEGQQFALHMAENTVMPLDDYIEADWTEEDIADHLNWDFGLHTDGNKYVFPISYLAMALFVRDDLLQEEGLEAPSSVNEFIEVAHALNSPSVPGFLFPGSPAQTAQINWIQALIEDRGGQLLDDDGRAVFNSQAGVETFEFLNALVHDEGVTPVDAGSISYDEVTDTFAAGGAAMIFEGSHRYTTVADTLGEENISVVPLPGVNPGSSAPTTVVGWTLGIPNGSNHPDEAWEFIKFFNTTESGMKYAEISGEIPVLQSVAEADFFNSPEFAVTNFFTEYVGENSTPIVMTRHGAELYDIVVEALQRVVIEPDPDVQQILDEAAARFNQLVD